MDFRKKLGWKPDIPDNRDRRCALLAAPIKKIPEKVNLRTKKLPVYDQGDLGSCTANAVAAAIDYDKRKQNLPTINPSRLALYYRTRQIERTIPYDVGATIRNAIKAAVKYGAPPEQFWPYIIANFKPEIDHCNWCLGHREYRRRKERAIDRAKWMQEWKEFKKILFDK